MPPNSILLRPDKQSPPPQPDAFINYVQLLNIHKMFSQKCRKIPDGGEIGAVGGDGEEEEVEGACGDDDGGGVGDGGAVGGVGDGDEGAVGGVDGGVLFGGGAVGGEEDGEVEGMMMESEEDDESDYSVESKNSFWFENFGLKKLSVGTTDGKRILDLHADFANDNYQMFYNAMVDELNIPITTGDMQLLDRINFNHGRFFFTVDCSRNHAAEIHDSVPIISKWELNLEFKEKLGEDLVLVLMYFETRGLSIDGARNVAVHSYH